MGVCVAASGPDVVMRPAAAAAAAPAAVPTREAIWLCMPEARTAACARSLTDTIASGEALQAASKPSKAASEKRARAMLLCVLRGPLALLMARCMEGKMRETRGASRLRPAGVAGTRRPPAMRFGPNANACVPAGILHHTVCRASTHILVPSSLNAAVAVEQGPPRRQWEPWQACMRYGRLPAAAPASANTLSLHRCTPATTRNSERGDTDNAV